MAKFLPTGWKMSRDGAARFATMLQKINAIVKKRTRKYNLTSLDPDDLMQEGRLAAAYAVDTYLPTRGNLDGYISTVVNNALAMIAAEALAQSRQPYKSVQDSDGSWRRTPAAHVELEHETAFDDTWDEAHTARVKASAAVARSESGQAKLDQLRLSPDAQAVLQLRMRTPPELLVLARNLNRGRLRLEANCVCRYLGWEVDNDTDRVRYQRATRELRDQFRYVLGVHDQTFESLNTPLVNIVPNKRRNLQELRA